MQDAHDFNPVIQGKVENQVFFNGKKPQGRMQAFARCADFRMLGEKAAFFFYSVYETVGSLGIILGNIIPDLIKVLKRQGPPENSGLRSANFPFAFESGPPALFNLLEIKGFRRAAVQARFYFLSQMIHF